jgi:glycosyltransferase involved in cell wall biosynthesis
MINKFKDKVSIVVSVYNDSKYVKEAIDSALAQTYKNTEVIVINSAGKDNDKTEEICKSYGDKIRYFKNDNRGTASALNLGVEKMKGEYLLWISHSLFRPEETDDLITKLTSEKNYDERVVIGKVQQESSEQSEWQTSFIFNPEVRINECHILASKEFLMESITDDEIRSSLLQKLSEEEIREYVKDKVESYWPVYYSFKELGYEKFPYVLLNRMHEVWGKEKEVSVIVPVYKVEKYIEECLESLLEQTLMELEIIVVNDGTPDNSAKIAERYTNLCPSFTKMIHKENGGLGSARNKGLEHVSGGYVGFVDSDDYVDKEMFKKMYEKIVRGYDIVICEITGIDSSSGDVKWKHQLPEDIKNWDHSKVVMHSTLKIAPGACNKLFKRELLDKIPWGSGFFEDLQATPTYISYADKIGFIREPYYYYRVNREGSIMSTSRDDKRCLAFLEAWENLLKYSNPEYREEIIYAIYVHIVDIVQAFPAFFDEYMAFFRSKIKMFKKNSLIEEDLGKGKIKNLYDAKLVPNITLDNKIETLGKENENLRDSNKRLEQSVQNLEENKLSLQKENENLRDSNKQLEQRIQRLKENKVSLESETDDLKVKLQVMKEERESLESSLSWRFTKPMRVLRKWMNKKTK